MAGTGVFVLQNETTLVAMQAASFATEDDFQRLLASFPELLAGDQIDQEVPRRFLLIAREQGIAAEEGAGNRWSLDHLFLDQDGIPTLVEVKRGTDTRIRREVVGQMLDYAANSILHWPVETLRARFASRCELEALDPDETLASLIGEEADPETFWAQVRTNLQAGRVRLLFVADRIPPELRRVVEFLNRQMQPAEVLAIELRQYEGQGLKTLVPLVLGQTQEASAKKSPSGRPPGAKRLWDEAGVLAAIEASLPEEVATVARALADWARRHADTVEFNDNPNWGSLTPIFRVGKTVLSGPFRLWSDGSFNTTFQYMLDRPVFADAVLREELRRRLNEVPGIALGPDAVAKRPTVKLAPIGHAGLPALISAFDWFAKTLRAGASPDGSTLAGDRGEQVS